MKKSGSLKDGKSERQEMSKNEEAQKSSPFGLPDFCRLSDYKGLYIVLDTSFVPSSYDVGLKLKAFSNLSELKI
jgi:hypothetical protein